MTSCLFRKRGLEHNRVNDGLQGIACVVGSVLAVLIGILRENTQFARAWYHHRPVARGTAAADIFSCGSAAYFQVAEATLASNLAVKVDGGWRINHVALPAGLTNRNSQRQHAPKVGPLWIDFTSNQ